MGVVLMAAIVLAAWRFANNVSANIIFNLTVAMLIIATYQAKFTPGRQGAWWSGFATLGWVHLVLWLAGMPWERSYSFRVSFISDTVFWILAAIVGLDQGAFDLRLDFEPTIARTLILQSLTSLVVGFVGAWAFSFVAFLGQGQRAPESAAQ